MYIVIPIPPILAENGLILPRMAEFRSNQQKIDQIEISVGFG
jgi:hypothetical protein